MVQQVDVLVVGAGIAGAGVAAHLAQSNSVVVLDMEARPGYHSTGRSAAMFAMHYGNAPIKKLNRASWDLFHDLPKTYFPNPILTNRGVLHVANAEAKAQLDELMASDQTIEPISVAKAVAMVPILDASNCVAAGLEREAKDLDVAALHYGYLKQTKQLGGQVICDAQVSDAEYVDGMWHVETAKGQFRAKVVVNAAGAWADEIAIIFRAAPVGLRAKRRTIATLPSSHPDVSHSWPMVLSAAEDWYLKPDAGSFLVSPGDADVVPPHDVFVDDMVLAEGLYRFSEATTYEVSRVDSSWAGLRVFAPDKTPVCGFAAGVEGFFWLAGQGGYGIQTAPALSLLASQMILQQSLPEFADAQLINDLSPTRAALKQ